MTLFSTTNKAVVALVIAFGLAARLWLAWTAGPSWDHDSYVIVASIVERGGNVYAETARYNYSPLWSFVLYGASLLARAAGAPLHSIVGTFLTASDLCLALLIATLARFTDTRPIVAFGAYWLNPVPILVSSGQGQFEGLAALPLVAALILAERRPDSPPLRTVWVLGTIAVLVKQLVVYSALALFVGVFGLRGTPGRAYLLWALSGSVFLASLLPYFPEGGPGIVNHVLRYGSVPGIWGLGALLPRIVSYPFFHAAMLTIPLIARRNLGGSPTLLVGTSAIALLTLMDGIGEQYWVVPVALCAAAPGGWFLAFSAGAGLYLLGSPHNIGVLPPWIPLNVVWILCAGWLVHTFFTLRRRTSDRGGLADARRSARQTP